MTDRLPCIVPFCRRTAPAGIYSEIICAPHWRMVGHRTKWLYAAVKRRLRRVPTDDARRRQRDRVWARCKREAIEAAAGIAS